MAQAKKPTTHKKRAAPKRAAVHRPTPRAASQQQKPLPRSFVSRFWAGVASRWTAWSAKLRKRAAPAIALEKRAYQEVTAHSPRMLGSHWFAGVYALLALFVLLAVTGWVAYLGARVQQSNADQLVNAYLFTNHATFHGANFPGQHTFLFKWPLFWLVALLGSRPADFIWITVGVVLLTVLLFALILWRIERRALYFGTLCLALASVLAAVPALPYPSGLLPVNMAMITTRNLEYILYIVSVALLVRAPRLRSWSFVGAAGVLGVLAASDKLFLVFGVGSALLACVVYALVRGWSFVTQAVRWLMVCVVGALLATALLAGIHAGGWTNIINGAQVSPYGAVHSAKDILLGVVYGVLALLTNLGVNPAGDVRLLHTVPQQTLHTLLSWGGFALLVNSALVLAGGYAIFRVLGRSMGQEKNRRATVAQRLSLLLIWTSLVAAAVFVATNHYYPVDARYVTVVLFAVFIAGATFLRTKQFRHELLVGAGLVLCLSIASGLVVAHRSYQGERAALSPLDARNKLIAEALGRHPVPVLLGDYWRVIPTKLADGRPLQVMPLESCTSARDVLSSKAWQPDPNKTGFAYLLTFDQSLTGYPHCTLDIVVQAFGRPNASIVIAGNVSSPQELLLFYDQGAHKSAPTAAVTSQVSTVTPISPEELPYTTCPQATVMITVAHQDDDLLFMNPDLMHDIQAGRCVRTVYLTAGDAGSGQFYWVGREQGAEAAYSTMLGSSAIWVQRLVRLADNSVVTVANPRGNSRVSLIFMHLPDGNVRGEGFAASHYESLARLEAGEIPAIHAIDGESSYTSQHLIDTLARLMAIYHPAEIRTQANFASKLAPDHSDHMAVSRFTSRAYEAYRRDQLAGLTDIPVVRYIGYPIRAMQPNVGDGDLAEKEKIFFVYAAHDNGVCHSEQECVRESANYRMYLSREYYE